MKHDSARPLRCIPPIRRTFAAISIVLSFGFALAAFGVPLGTSFTYQGQLRRGGAPYNGTCNFQFSLWDAANGGAQEGLTQSINNVTVGNGLFTVLLDFGTTIQGDDHFYDGARWLATSVQCSGDGGFTPLAPRQPITAVPVALSLRPGARSAGNEFTGSTLTLFMSGSDQTSTSALTAVNSGAGSGVIGQSKDGAGIQGISGGSGSAIYGEAFGTGLAGNFVGPVEIEGRLKVSNTPGVGLSASGITGVSGSTTSATGVGVKGTAAVADSTGVWGSNIDGTAVLGTSLGTGTAIYGSNAGDGFAGRFTGPVLIEGNLIVQGVVSKNAGSFRIDHPLDPANKFLSHSFVESPDMMNIYNGNITTDANGNATVTLPDYFAALNRDYRYQLTVLGQFAQAIVSRKIAGNSFEIRTDKAGVEVSWQVTGIRQDAYAKEHPIVAEEFKPAEEKGLYLYPAGFGAGKDKSIGAPSRPEIPQR